MTSSSAESSREQPLTGAVSGVQDDSLLGASPDAFGGALPPERCLPRDFYPFGLMEPLANAIAEREPLAPNDAILAAFSKDLYLALAIKTKRLEMLLRDKDQEIATLIQQRRDHTRLIEKLILLVPNAVPQEMSSNSVLRDLVLRTLPPPFAQMLAKVVRWLRHLARLLVA